ncbi:hypothetical protein [Kordia sp.]|uniref:hypothetical protein n=1 Tax=Kordia sp. TaxID=1965332 RepID=UPI003B5B16B0
MKKLNILVFVITLFFSCQTQNKPETVNIKRITLSYGHTMSQQSLVVHIEKYQQDNIHVNYKYVPLGAANSDDYKFTSYHIDTDKFNKIVATILKIDRANIEKEAETIGLDGSSTSISFYEKGKNTILNTYSIWSPDYNTQQRKLDDYIYAYKELVKLARMEADSLF